MLILSQESPYWRCYSSVLLVKATWNKMHMAGDMSPSFFPWRRTTPTATLKHLSVPWICTWRLHEMKWNFFLFLECCLFLIRPYTLATCLLWVETMVWCILQNEEWIFYWNWQIPVNAADSCHERMDYTFARFFCMPSVEILKSDGVHWMLIFPI